MGGPGTTIIIMSLFSELRRRNVFKVLLVYLIAGWLIIKLLHPLPPVIGLPHWIEKLVGLILIVGLPLALYFAYIYEITPVGLKKTVDVDQTQSIVYKTGQKLNAALAVVTVLMLAALIAVSFAFPAELLGPADPAALVESVPIDPFFLFLLPGLARVPGLGVIVLFLALTAFLTYLPWLLNKGDGEVIAIDPDACTGCELCVIDCPYKALQMVEPGDRAIAEVDPRACVACGICIGSCVFDAIDLPGATISPSVDVAGRDVVLACDRHR